MPSSPSLGREGLRLWPRWKTGCERKEGGGRTQKEKSGTDGRRENGEMRR